MDRDDTRGELPAACPGDSANCVKTLYLKDVGLLVSAGCVGVVWSVDDVGATIKWPNGKEALVMWRDFGACFRAGRARVSAPEAPAPAKNAPPAGEARRPRIVRDAGLPPPGD